MNDPTQPDAAKAASPVKWERGGIKTATEKERDGERVFADVCPLCDYDDGWHVLHCPNTPATKATDAT